jgi:hypothetical protein
MPEQMKRLIPKCGPPQSILNSTSNGISAYKIRGFDLPVLKNIEVQHGEERTVVCRFAIKSSQHVYIGTSRRFNH